MLHFWDYAVIIFYLGAMLVCGGWLARRGRTPDDYFLAGRQMPWLAVGVSVIASLLSSLTYLSEPGEIWKSGVTHVAGKLLGIPLEMVVVWFICIPFLMRFRYTSVYEYLEDRFDRRTRRVGVFLFLSLVVLWMGFVVLATSQALEAVSGVPLAVILVTVGVVATIYTMLGGLRAVIWTDVVQVSLLIGGGAITIGTIAWTTRSGLGDWYTATGEWLQANDAPDRLPWFSLDPRVRATVWTVALNMMVWHICTHTANQMTVQRYFSTDSRRSARRSFVTASLFGVGLNLMLAVVGLAVLYFYTTASSPPSGLDVLEDRDRVFPTFVVQELPAGVGGAILAALLAAAMSSIDSGVNSIATVLTVEWGHGDGRPASRVRRARWITLTAGAFITLAAWGLTYLPPHWGIVGAIPRTFNAITAPLGGMFLAGMFLPRCGPAAVLSGTFAGMVTSLGMGYLANWSGILAQWGWLDQPLPELSFAWIMPVSFVVTLGVSAAASCVVPSPPPRPGLTWFTRAAPAHVETPASSRKPK